MRLKWLAATILLTAGCATTRSTEGIRSDEAASNTAIAADFRERIDRYMELRRKAVEEVPDATVTDDPAAIRARELLLAAQIRSRRLRATHGDIFTPEIRAYVRGLLRPELKGAQLDNIKDALKEDAPAPGAVAVEVNAPYPAGVPFSTTPSSILLALPPLPTGIEYRIVGKDLILLDQPADVILDYIRNIIP